MASNKKKKSIIGLRELRENTDKVLKGVKRGDSFTVVRRSEPVFRITPVEEEWEEVADLTKIRKGGVDIDDLLKRL
jgi:prevent-host-death family protein